MFEFLRNLRRRLFPTREESVSALMADIKRHALVIPTSISIDRPPGVETNRIEAHTACRLWMLLDAIDTLDDACRDNDADFRLRCRAIQRQRFNIISGQQMDEWYGQTPPSITPTPTDA